MVQVEDDNTNGSRGITSSTAASKEAELKIEMIRLYRGMLEGVNTSSVASTTGAETELMIRNIYRETICPMFWEDFNQMHQNYLLMVRETFGLDLSMGMTWNLCNTESTSESQSLQLKFLNGISTPVSTGKNIKGDKEEPFVVALVDEISGQIVTKGAEAAMEVEIVVLDGNSNDDEADKWTTDEFNHKIISEWKGKNVLKGNRLVKLNEGTVSVDKISFTHNSEWKEDRKCRIGARSVNAVFPTRVREAKTESFLVRDKRKDLYIKHEIPSLSDRLYRLREMSPRGDCFKLLSKERIETVMDLLTFHAINPQGLRKKLKVGPNKCKIIMDHANMCKDDKSKGVYLYPRPRDGETSNGVAFNISGQLVGIIAESHFVPCDKLPDDKRADAEKLILSSSEHWKEVVSFRDHDLLSVYLQSRPTMNPSAHNNLNVVLPETFDPHNHTNLTSLKSQSPKRPASENAISNSPKQPRYDHPELSHSMPSVGMDTSICHEANNMESQPADDDISMYLNLNLPDTWKIVCYAVGWISMISKPRKRRTTFCHDNKVIVIAASI